MRHTKNDRQLRREKTYLDTYEQRERERAPEAILPRQLPSKENGKQNWQQWLRNRIFANITTCENSAKISIFNLKFVVVFV